MISNEEKQWAMLCHLAALAGLIGIPYGNVLGPLVVWLWKRNDSLYIDRHGKESLNFQITVLIAAVVCVALMFILIGIPLMFAVGIGALVLTIIAAVKVSNGQYDYKYPFAIRLIK